MSTKHAVDAESAQKLTFSELLLALVVAKLHIGDFYVGACTFLTAGYTGCAMEAFSL